MRDLLIPPAPPVDLGGIHLTAALHPGGFRFPDRGGEQLKDCGANERANKI